MQLTLILLPLVLAAVLSTTSSTVAAAAPRYGPVCANQFAIAVPGSTDFLCADIKTGANVSRHDGGTGFARWLVNPPKGQAFFETAGQFTVYNQRSVLVGTYSLSLASGKIEYHAGALDTCVNSSVTPLVYDSASNTLVTVCPGTSGNSDQLFSAVGINADSGARRWFAPNVARGAVINSVPSRSAVVLDGTFMFLVMGSSVTSLYGLDAATGKPRYTPVSVALGSVTCSAATYATKYFVCYGDNVRAFEPRTGKELWRESDLAAFAPTPQGGVLSYASLTKNLQLRSQADGQLLFSTVLNISRYGAPEIAFATAHPGAAPGSVALVRDVERDTSTHTVAGVLLLGQPRVLYQKATGVLSYYVPVPASSPVFLYWTANDNSVQTLHVLAAITGTEIGTIGLNAGAVNGIDGCVVASESLLVIRTGNGLFGYSL
jgi:hypothetical protein